MRGPREASGGLRPGLRGVMGRPFLRLDGLLNLAGLDAVHDEVCRALAEMPTEYTGGSHRSMEIMPPGTEHTALVDYGEVIAALDDAQYDTLCSLADDPDAAREVPRDEAVWGEERALPLSRRQMLWLEYRHRVYFPWKVYLEMIPNRWWGDKSRGADKRFTRLAESFLPRTVAFVRSLPFVEIGRCNVMGLRAHDHGTVHRDGEPESQGAPDHFITLCPVPGKRLYLYDPTADGERKVPVDGTAYWFNDHDYHGVEADPYFRYSIRVDGVFRPEFVEALQALARDGGGAP
jgi:hypothetical protein